MTSLPMLRTGRQKLLFGTLLALVCALLYGLSGRLAEGRTATLALTDWEKSIPYLSFTVWFYLAQYPLIVAAYLTCRNLARCTRFAYAALLVQTAAATMFLIAPLRYPRELYSQAAVGEPLTRALVEWVHAVDTPVNCFPSLHVTSCILSMLLVGAERLPRALACGVVAVASMASTLTFKQHYAIDLPAGAVLAGLVWWAVGRCLAAAQPAVDAAVRAHAAGAGAAAGDDRATLAGR